MDKFGIFNLINSFLTPKQSEAGSSAQSSGNGLSSILSMLSSLKKNDNTSGDARPPQETAAKPQRQTAPHPPLQASMLNTIKNHDEFVRRVKEKAKTT